MLNTPVLQYPVRSTEIGPDQGAIFLPKFWNLPQLAFEILEIFLNFFQKILVIMSFEASFDRNYWTWAPVKGLSLIKVLCWT